MSIGEIAKLAGVSHATVSRVINNRPGVSPARIKIVREAMRNVGFRPSSRGRRLGATPRAGDVAMLMIGADLNLLLAPVASAALHGAQDALAQRGFNMLFGKLNDAGRLPPQVTSGRVDGLLLYGYPPPRKLHDQLSHFPCVWLLSPRAGRGFWGDRVQPDNEAIGRLAANYLADRGHTEVAMLNLSPDHLGYRQRTDAFASTTRSRGGRARVVVRSDGEQAMPFVASFEAAQVAEAVDEMLADGPMPTGLFVPRDPLLVPVYRELRLRGVEPGRDIAVIGCNNERVLDGLEPRPATIDLQPRLIGQQAVEQLLRRIEQPSAPESVVLSVKPTLVEGDGQARGNGT